MRRALLLWICLLADTGVAWAQGGAPRVLECAGVRNEAHAEVRHFVIDEGIMSRSLSRLEGGRLLTLTIVAWSNVRIVAEEGRERGKGLRHTFDRVGGVLVTNRFPPPPASGEIDLDDLLDEFRGVCQVVSRRF
ncbi:hypothetical protein ACLF3G_04485 [Falsiroseomonas sp. HC035]|uniref:hypothetical protein n=1 Tax=Falsiroseomonas sp. HC035 TaxID=3390999 RepID=UPI003D317736